jgi:hypothetical protein
MRKSGGRDVLDAQARIDATIPNGRSALIWPRARFKPSAPDGSGSPWRRAAARLQRHGHQGARLARERAIASACASPGEAVQHQVNRIIAAEIARANEKLAHDWNFQFPHEPKFKNPRAKFNFQGRTCSITGVGSYVPEKVLTNAALEKLVETSDEWITSRTGIKERRMAAKDEFTSDMAAKAAQRAMKMAGVTAEPN